MITDNMVSKAITLLLIAAVCLFPLAHADDECTLNTHNCDVCTPFASACLPAHVPVHFAYAHIGDN